MDKENRTNLSLDKSVSTDNVEDRNKLVAKEERDSAENLKAFRKGIMALEQRAGLKSSDNGVPIPTAWFEGVEKAWEKVDIINEASFSEFKGVLYQSGERQCHVSGDEGRRSGYRFPFAAGI